MLSWEYFVKQLGKWPTMVTFLREDGRGRRVRAYLSEGQILNCDRPPPVALKGRSGPGRSLDRRFKRITYEKNQNPMNVVFLYREHLVGVSPKLSLKTGPTKKNGLQKKVETQN